MGLLKQELWSWWLREALLQNGLGSGMRLGMGARRMGVGGFEEINLLLMGAFLIDFS
jgi:hypothetical protein